MKITHTHIVGVESDQCSVLIKYRKQGSDSADRPMAVRVTPHSGYIHMNLSFGADEVITNVEHGANIVNVSYGNTKEYVIDWGKNAS